MPVFRPRVSAPAPGWLAVATAVTLLIAAWVIMLREGWTVVSAAAVIASSWIVAGVYLAGGFAAFGVAWPIARAPDLLRISDRASASTPTTWEVGWA